MQVLLANFPKLTPDFNIEPLGGFLRFPFSRFPAVADRQAEVGHVLAGGREATLGVLAETTGRRRRASAE